MDLRPRRALRLLAALGVGRRLPFSVTFVLTHRCNSACAHCDIHLDARQELPTAAWLQALEELTRLGLARASFSGGEVLLRDDLGALLAQAKALGLLTSLNTNAWLLAPRWAALAPFLDMLVVSLDGARERHDRRRGQPGAFTRTLAALDEARVRGIATASITVLDRDNLGVVDEVLELAREHRFWAFFQPRQQSCFDAAAGLACGLEREDLVRIAAQLGQAQVRGYPVGASRAYLARLRQGGRTGGCAGCSAGRHFASVLPDGSLVPCHLTARLRDHPRGSQAGFAAAWRGLECSSTGPGCLISPYQELDALFHLDPRAWRAAWRRLRRVG
jgi:MoaA/NifB/PqqE/SkfB family radical SAM enzyme